MTDIALATLSLPNRDASAKDITRLSLVWEDSSFPTASNFRTVFDALLNTNHGTAALGAYLAPCLDRTADAGEIDCYNITPYLSGVPHGSPYDSGPFTLTAALGASVGNQLAAVLTITDTGYASEPVFMGSGSVPTPESAQDMGAPASHTGNLRGKARHANRIYLGPISDSAVVDDGNGNPIFGSTFVTDAAAALSALRAAYGLRLRVWSRRDAAVRPWAGGWVDHGVKTRRKRAFVPNTRTTWS